MNRLIEFIKKNEFKYLIFTSIVIKLLFFIVVFFINTDYSGKFFFIYADDNQYIEYCENFLNFNSYYYEYSKGIKDYTFRMPGMAFIYIPLRFFFSKIISLNIYVIFQFILSVFSTFILAKIAFIFTKSYKVFLLTFLIINTHLLSSFYTNTLMTESLAGSIMIFGLYSFLLALEKEKNVFFLISGLLLTWLIFLRPFMLVFLILLAVYLILKLKSKAYRYLLIFIFPFIIIDGTWTLRNFYVSGRLTPLQYNSGWIYNGNKSLISKTHFIRLFGFHWENWREDSESTWFNNKFESSSVSIPSNEIFPERTFNGDLTIDSLVYCRKLMHQVVDTSLNLKLRIYSDFQSSRILEKFINNLKTYRPVDYYIVNPIRLLYSYLSFNTIKQFKTANYPLNLILVFYDSFSSIMIKFLGIIGLILLTIKYRLKLIYFSLITFIPYFLILFFPFILRVDESRFLYLAYPFLSITSAFFILEILKLKFGIIKLLSIIILLFLYTIFYCNSIFHII